MTRLKIRGQDLSHHLVSPDVTSQPECKETLKTAPYSGLAAAGSPETNASPACYVSIPSAVNTKSQQKPANAYDSAAPPNLTRLFGTSSP
ncbi:uncharacterized protein TrAtP1_004360 [Trichoderma atroviride]|uniref:uncharacterized protein n=1 Tax=Hypocrea atroviridis TaxID=63577 RepID=UPI003326FB2B|nr:hypothetical protein TrAtP1_004360 [Trichoderma atroviride]